MWCSWFIPLLLLFGAALIGAIIGWLLRGNKIQAIRDEYESKISTLNQSVLSEKEAKDKLIEEHSDLQSQETAWNKKLASAEADALLWKNESSSHKSAWDKSLVAIKVLETKLFASQDVDNSISPDVEKRLKENDVTLEENNVAIKQIEAQLEELEKNSVATITAILAEKEALEAQVQALQNKENEVDNSSLSLENEYKNKLKELREKLDDQDLEINTWSKQHKQLKNEREQALKNYQLLETTTKMDMDAIKKEKQKEIERLSLLLAAKQKKENEPTKQEVDSVPLTPEEETTLERIKEKAKNLNFERIGIATFADKNDLKVIKGIGPFIEQKLHALGIFTFWQIANLSPEDEDKVNDAIDFFPGRIKRDEWVKQGGELHKENEEKKNKADDKDR